VQKKSAVAQLDATSSCHSSKYPTGISIVVSGWKKILVPTDFSETSKKAVQYALRFAEQFGCEIALLYVVEPATPMVGAPLAVEVFTDKDEFSIAEKDLAVLAAESHTNGAHSVSSFVARRTCA
jgi:nucleotide-binding universal stress UspA family protein